MKIDSLYDKVAQTYNQQQSADVLLLANTAALHMSEGLAGIERILSLGVGDGLHFKPYQQYYPNAEFAGLDISAKMLEKAQNLMEMAVYQGDIVSATKVIKQRDFNLITAHFVLAYVSLEDTLTQAKKLLAPEGCLSIVTNTMDSFPAMYEIFVNFGKSANPWLRLVHKYMQSILTKVYVPQTLDELVVKLKSNQFEVVDSEIKKIPITLTNEEDVYNFFINGGWFVSGFNHPILPSQLLSKISKRLIKKYINTPFDDTVEVAVVLVRK